MQGRTPIILLSTTAEAPEMQTLLPHGNMMNLVALCLYEVSWTKLIVALKNSTGLSGNGLVRLHGRCCVSHQKRQREGNFDKSGGKSNVPRASRPRTAKAATVGASHSGGRTPQKSPSRV